MPPPMVRRAPYRDFLQPTLQRRFASTALVLLAVAYVESLVLSNWDSLIWSWFPLGFAGLRAFTIFSCGMVVTILRIAHTHVGIRTTNSPLDTFRQNALSLTAFETVSTYVISAFLFSQVYLFSVADGTNLQWITYHSGDRARLNERALFYTVSLTLLGLFEGLAHMYLDYDRLTLGYVKARGEGEANKPAPKAEDPFEKLLKDAPRLVIRSVTNSILVACVNYLFLYSIFRRSAWAWAISIFRWFYTLPRSNIPPTNAPWSFWMLGRSITAGILLSLLWNFSNAAFTYRLAKEPIKNGQPLTAESKDPNGSLLNGLKSKKPKTSAFAMWELALIARDYDVRRKAIFEDIDRKDGPMWSQIYAVCLNTIKELEQRIDSYGKPLPAPAFPQQPNEPTQAVQRVVEPPLSADVWLKPGPPKNFRDTLSKTMEKMVHTEGKKPAEVLVPFAKKSAADIRDQLLSKQRQEQLSAKGFIGTAQSIALYLIRLPVIGQFFQQVYSNRLATVVLGTPFGEVSVYANAAFALSELAVKSLEEDKYGVVSRDVPAIIRAFTTIIQKLDVFGETMPIHWTDFSGERRCGPVEEVLDALREGLRRIVDSFEMYRGDLRLTRSDIRLAKEAAMKQIRAHPEQQKPKSVQNATAEDFEDEGQPEMRQLS